MGAGRERDQADFDLERFVDMFDEAMTSRDPRVMKTLRDLMMIVALTRSETNQHIIEDRQRGPLRLLYDDVKVAHRRISDVEDTLMSMSRQIRGGSKHEYQIEQDKIAEQKIAAQTAMNMLPSEMFRNIALSKGLTKK